MKVLQVVPSISAESSGPSYSVPAMCNGLHNAGCDVSLHFVGERLRKTFGFPVHAYKFHRLPHPRLGRSPEMLRALKGECKTAQIIHNNSLWMMPNIYPAWAKRGTDCKLVMQPRGTLSEWALSLSKWRKRLVGWYGQDAAMRNADMWVATAESEYEDIRRLGYEQPICILPNGVDLPVLKSDLAQEQSDSAKSDLKSTRRRMLFLSRIHPKKNVDILLRAWSKLENRYPDWDLSIVGPDKNNGYADEMKVLSGELRCERVKFVGELRGEAKYRYMAESDCFILPTHSENFGMVVAESLACGTPVICSHGAPWEGLNREKCGWWVATDETAITNAMKMVMSMERDELSVMGLRGRDWMKRDFDWNAIGRKMKMAYEWLLGRVDRPDWVFVG